MENYIVGKTQIAWIRSGTKRQILNPDVDYSTLPKATSHIGHAGTNHDTVMAVWEKVVSENRELMKISIKGIEINLKANWSISGKSVSYFATLTPVLFERLFGLKSSKYGVPTINICSGNTILISNGHGINNYNLCPSFVTILD